MVTTHPSDETLELYASGSLTEGMDVFVKGHLHFCPTCRAKVEVLEMVAGELLSEDIISADLSSLSFQNVLSKVDEQESRELKETKESIHGGVMPNMINNLIGKTSEDIAWRFRLPGISDYQISNHNGEEISLLKAEPGAKIFQHTHDGEEATLVLSGALRDGDSVLRSGDVSIVNETHTHNPSIIGNEPCICLIVMSGKVKFTGRFTRAFNLLT
jgi:putative transcriptional regulator